MNWTIAGTGALASLWATALHKQGEKVVIYSRHPQDEPRAALSVKHETDISVAELPVITQASQAAPDSVWLLLVKAWQLGPLIQQIGWQLPADAVVVLSHNGLGAAERELAGHPNWQLYDLVTTQAAWRASRLQTVHAGKGESWLGPRQQGLAVVPPWFELLQQALPPLAWDSNILNRRWVKLAVNCAINPLATLAGVENGVLQEPEYQLDIRAVCEEVAAVEAAHRGHNYIGSADTLEQSVYSVIHASAKNRCSMLQDKVAGRPTEIDYLNGYICYLGKMYDTPTPTNHKLWQAVTDT